MKQTLKLVLFVRPLYSIFLYLYQSNFYSSNIPGVVRLSGATARSVFKYEVVEAIP